MKLRQVSMHSCFDFLQQCRNCAFPKTWRNSSQCNSRISLDFGNLCKNPEQQSKYRVLLHPLSNRLETQSLGLDYSWDHPNGWNDDENNQILYTRSGKSKPPKC